MFLEDDAGLLLPSSSTRSVLASSYRLRGENRADGFVEDVLIRLKRKRKGEGVQFGSRREATRRRGSEKETHLQSLLTQS